MVPVLRWKLTAAMAVCYVAVAAAIVFFVQDANSGVAALVVLFALVLLAGNMYTRRMDRVPGAGCRVPGTNDDASIARHPAPVARHPAPVTRHPAPGTRHPAPGARHPDPELGRR